jgi:predicted Zn-dependent protease
MNYMTFLLREFFQSVLFLAVVIIPALSVADSSDQAPSTDGTPFKESSDVSSDAEVKKIYEKIEQKKQEIRKEYEDNPDSERAHWTYASQLISDREFSRANEVLQSLRKINPKSKVAEVLENQISELEGSDATDKTSPEMMQRHMSDFLEAVQADTVDSFGASSPAASQLMDSDSNDFMADVDSFNKENMEKLRKRYPDICEKLSAHDSADDFEIQSQLLKVQLERGRVGLLNEYQELMKKYPKLQTLSQSYAEFLLEEKEYDKAQEYVSRKRQEFPDNIAFKILEEGLKEAAMLPSNEQKRGRIALSQLDLMTLSLIEEDCLN